MKSHSLKPRRRFTLCLGLFIVLVSLPVSIYCDGELTVVSWGASYERAHVEGYINSFEESTGIKVVVEDFSGGLAQIRAQVEADHVTWDVVDLESQDSIIGCDEGLFEYLDDLELPPAADGTPAEQDFFDGAIADCGIGTLAWSTVIAYNTEVYETDPPSTIKDFFDLEKYPGKRGMRRTPEANFEFALLADGVPVEEVYETLSTPEGIERAFKKLDQIKDSIIFWETGAHPPQLLSDQEVVMTTVFNGRIFNAQVMEDQPFEIIWDGQVRDFEFYVIVAGTPNLENAKKFLQYATLASSMANVSNRISYGPVRKSALDLVDRHVETGVEMQPHLPTSPQNSFNVLTNNAEWWAENKDHLNERFSTWLAN